MEQTPTFDLAAQRLQRFLAEQGWPAGIVWRRERDVVHLPGGEIVVRQRSEPKASLEVRAHYEVGFHLGVGIAMHVPSELDGAACATVYWTTDATEAEYRMLPEHGLKLSVADRRPKGRSVGLLSWWLATRRWRL